MYDTLLIRADRIKMAILDAKTPSEIMAADLEFNKLIVAFERGEDGAGEMESLFQNTVSYLSGLLEEKRESVGTNFE